MTDDVKALIEEARQQVRSANIEGIFFTVKRLADALEAATVAPAVDREALGDIIRPHIADEYIQGQVSPSDEVVLDDIFASGVLRDVRDVQAEGADLAADWLAQQLWPDAADYAGHVRQFAQGIREARND